MESQRFRKPIGSTFIRNAASSIACSSAKAIGGPPGGLFVQVVDDLGEELPIPGRDFGFRRLIAAQAAGDFEALRERGREIVRVTL